MKTIDNDVLELDSAHYQDLIFDGDFDPVNAGLPKLDLADKPFSRFEFWPAWFFYIPVGLYWLLLAIRYRSLSLPLLANPTIDLGGMVGESKTDILDLANEQVKECILPYLTFLIDADFSAQRLLEYLGKAEQLGICFPLIAKPDLGCRGTGVRLVENIDQLNSYIQAFPVGRRLMLQKLAPYQAEAGVFYERMPHAAQGRITSITLKYRPYVRGDGKHCLRDLILADPRASRISDLYLSKNMTRLHDVPAQGEYVAIAFAGSHCRGSIFRDGRCYITPQLESALDEVLQGFEQFHYGRLDIKFKDINAFMAGKDFAIIEINGVSSEATHIWDSRSRLRDTFVTLLRQYRILFAMGDQMRASGRRPPSIWGMIRVWLHELSMGSNYPPTS